MKLLKPTPESIWLPLLVMLLLTLLVGLTAFQLTNTWQASMDRSMRSAVQAVMLTNIRWGLYRVQRDLPDHPEIAQRRWGKLREQATLLMQTEPGASSYQRLQAFLSTPDNIHRIGSLPEKSVLRIPLGTLQDDLNALRVYAQQVTVAVTTCMIVLGALLTAITGLDLSRLLRALVRSRDLNIRVQEDERRRIAQELHDGAVQELIDLKRHYSPDKVDALIETLRRVCHNLKPQVLEDLGLAAAIEFLADDLRLAGVTQVQLNLDARELAALPKAYELPLFRVIQEMCSNIKNHAQADQATITLIYDPRESPLLRGYVSDNGRGFDLKATDGQRLGLSGIRERLEQLGGTLRIESTPGQGSRFQLAIPIKGLAKGETAHARSA